MNAEPIHEAGETGACNAETCRMECRGRSCHGVTVTGPPVTKSLRYGRDLSEPSEIVE